MADRPVNRGVGLEERKHAALGAAESLHAALADTTSETNRCNLMPQDRMLKTVPQKFRKSIKSRTTKKHTCLLNRPAGPQRAQSAHLRPTQDAIPEVIRVTLHRKIRVN